MNLTKKKKNKIINYFLITQGLEIKEVTEFYNHLLLPPYGGIWFEDKIYQDKIISQKLYLSDNKISNIEPLSSLTNLTYLYLSSNNISNIEPLSPLTKLTYLSLYNNKIENIEPLFSLTNLTYLYL